MGSIQSVPTRDQTLKSTADTAPIFGDERHSKTNFSKEYLSASTGLSNSMLYLTI